MARSEAIAQAGAKLRAIRARLGLSVRDVEQRSLASAKEHQNPDCALSKTWITDVERGRFLPGSLKSASLGEIYGMTLAEIQRLYGIPPEDFAKKESASFRPPKTHLFPGADEPRQHSAPIDDASEQSRMEQTNLVTELVDIWGDIPAPLLRRFGLRRSLYGYIGTEDKTMVPLLPPGSFVQIDASQTRIRRGPYLKSSSESHFARPIYFLDFRSGYACGWCEVKDGVLTLIPHPDSGEQTRTFRYPSEVSVVGRVTAIAMSIEEERFVPIKELEQKRKKGKK